MCTIILYRGYFHRYPLVLAANRDEFLVRKQQAPSVLYGAPSVLCGRDPEGGGTWGGVNQHGLLVWITNRAEGLRAPDKRSRGLLCLELLRAAEVDAAVKMLRAVDHKRYNPFNLLVSDANGAVLAKNSIRSGYRITPIDTSITVITNWDDCEKLRQARSLAKQLPKDASIAEITFHLRSVLSSHTGDLSPQRSICCHTEGFGTRSATIIVLGEHNAYLFAKDAPCKAEFEDYSELLEEVMSSDEKG